METEPLGDASNLTSGRLLARNTIINLAGEGAPFLVALFAVPLVIHGLGVDRYGVLTLSMMVVGYFGLFDFGLDTAAIKFISEAAASGDISGVPGLFWTSLYLMFAFGLVAAVLIAALAPSIVYILGIPAAERSESLHAFYVLALSMPFVISGSSLSGTLSAFQRFDLINRVRVPAGIFYYIGPLIALVFSHHLGWIVTVVVAGRVAAWLASCWLCTQVVPSLLRDPRPRRTAIRPLLSFGGWIMVSGIVSPIMEYFDRFLIGAMLSVAAVTYYSVPFQVVGKLSVLPGSMGGVVFAALSGSFVQKPERAALIFERAARYTLLLLFAPVLVLVALAPEGLTMWLGASFAVHGEGVLRWLAVGAFIHYLAWTPYSLVQAAHRPDLIAKLHVAEVAFYLAFLWWMLPRYGVEGAAVAWTFRVTIDTIIVFFMSRRLLPLVSPAMVRLAEIGALMVAVFGLATVPMSLAAKGLFLVVALGSFALLGWTFLADSQERAMVMGYFRRIVPTTAGTIDHS